MTDWLGLVGGKAADPVRHDQMRTTNGQRHPITTTGIITESGETHVCKWKAERSSLPENPLSS